ncbi:MAG TPA: CPBP family intramembrane glutamic endopeptidase [Lacipirellulaceae bacterium]|nr:CPBP family intramembrane glutamic endopeptidase [Lacipirellulaceae bacterium]
MDNAESNANAKPNEPPESRALRWFALLSALGILAADFFVIGAATSFAVSASIFRTSQWNWFGKLASILFSCALLACSPWLRQNVGLRWRQAPGSFKLSAGCFVVFLGCAIGLGFLMPPAAFSVDTLLFQFFIPAIDEELLLRGIMLALLECAFGQSPMSCQLRFGYASLVISLFFGMAHAISFEDGQIHFAMLIFSITTIWAAVVALVRTRSGSLLWPTIMHGTWDGSIFLVAMLR